MIVAVWVPGRPITLNAERREHWRTHRAETRQSRSDATTIARGLPALASGFVVATPWCMAPLPDPGNSYPTAKSILDGMVDAGVLPGDKAPHVRGVMMLPPNKVGDARFEGMVVLVNEMSPSTMCPMCEWETTVQTARMQSTCQCPYPENRP